MDASHFFRPALHVIPSFANAARMESVTIHVTAPAIPSEREILAPVPRKDA